MENIYQETFTAIENGANFRIYFRSRNLKVDGRHVIRDGRFDGTLGLPEYGGGDFFTDVEELYRRYKYSIPSERSQSKSRRYFMALPESDLEDRDMLYGQYRDIAQFSGILYPMPDYRRVHVESRNDGQMVLAKRKRQGPGDTQRMGGPGSNQLLTNSQ